MMDDSRNDSTRFMRSILSPVKKGRYPDKSNDHHVLASRSTDDRKGISSPKNNQWLNTSATMDNSNLGIGICSSPSSNNDLPRKEGLTTESEISSLVHNALIRARQATKSFSPRTRPYNKSMSPRSTETLSPTSTLSNRGRPPVHSTSPLTSPTSSRPPVHTFSSSPTRKTISVPSLNSASRDSSEDPYGPSSKFQVDVGEQLSMKSSTADQSASSLGSTNSSDDIIRRVEEEIANARKAAQEATQRLAGVSASFMAEVQHSSPHSPRNFGAVPTRSNRNYYDGSLDAQLGEMMEGTVNRSSSTDEDGNFGSALDLIGEEFNGIVEGRTRSIEQCSLDFVPADELNALLQVGNDEKDINNGMKTSISINQSIDDISMDELEAVLSDCGMKTATNINRSDDNFRMDELEAVLSDEREQDIILKTNAERSRESASVTPEVIGVMEDSIEPVSVDQENSIDQDEGEEHDEMLMNMEGKGSDCMSVTQEMVGIMKDSLEPDIPFKDKETLIDQAKTESTKTNSRERLSKPEDTLNLDEKFRDQTVLSTEVYTSFSKDTVTSGKIKFDEVHESIENPDETNGTNMRVNKSCTNESLEDTDTEVRCPDSSEQEELLGDSAEIENSVVSNNSDNVEDKIDDDEEVGNEISIDDDVDPRKNQGESRTDIKNLPSITKSKNDATISNKNSTTDDEAISDDQVTDITDNKDRSITTNRLLSYLSAERFEKTTATSGSMISPPRRQPSTSKTEDCSDSVGHIYDISRHEKKVQFKQRYPIPQKIKQFRQPSEILFDYQLEKPSNKLWQSMPKKDLKELLDAVTGTSIQRRSNACGALKVLSTQKKNQMTLVRTKGFMDALVFAISDDYSIEDTESGTAARTRAVNVVLNVSAMKDNRYHILFHPGLRDGLVKCMIEDKAEARELTCAVFATLAKSQHCRERIGKAKKLVDALATVLKRDDQPIIDDLDIGKIDYSGDDELSRVFSNTFSSSSSSSSTNNSSLGDDSVESQKEDPEMTRRTRMNACAALLHLSKECSVSQNLCASDKLLVSLVSCCNEVQNPLHTKCLQILANLTRFPQNNALLVDYPGLVDSLIVNGSQEDDSDRLWSMRIFQNLSSEPSAKAKLARSSILQLLSTNMMRKQYEEQLAATSTMFNISTEPGAVVPLTNTKNVVATLVHVAHSPTSIIEVRTIACDALATLGLWLQTLASSGTVPEGVKSVPLPTYITSGWQRWDE